MTNDRALAASIDPPAYTVDRVDTTATGLTDDQMIAHALAILKRRLRTGPVLDSPPAVRQFLTLQLGGLEYEVFGVVFLDNQHQLIEYAEMFRDTVSQTAVYPREVARKALALNASAVILVHNHPSGLLTPSRADEQLTQQMKQALALIDVRILDHIIVGSAGSLSFAERGLI